MTNSINQKNKEIVWDFWQRMNHVRFDDFQNIVKARMHAEVAWFGPQPINDLEGVDTVIANYWQPLYQSFPDLKRTCNVFMGGESCGEEWVSACGYLTGTFVRDWLGIPATGRKTHIHFGQFYRLEMEKIVESYLILDVLSVIRQAGFQVMPPARGAEGGKVLPPATEDGVLLTDQDALETRKSRQLVATMIQGMMRYNGMDLSSMEMANYWHPKMHWYGPTGIGSCFSLEEFEDFHQRPWLEAFPFRVPPDSIEKGRTIGIKNGEILAEGKYASLGVWNSPFGIHKGDFFGIPATDKTVTYRDFDWYRRDGDYLVQNWVPLDLIDIFLQVGVDLFERMFQQIEQRK
jgi:predicted ester cyclase